MGHDDLVIIGRVMGALVIGALIGFERTFHGRPAGFRTHSLVCIASAILMIVTVYQNQWMTLLEHDAIRTDPTRMAQGIMTGIGFLGAGVIFKEGLTVRGLTTAASIWVTAAIGILVGIGFGLQRLLARWRRSPCLHYFAISKLSYQVSSMRITCSDSRAITS
jgi:putative Mg2+ transporter-C (MgtC) family protein